MHIQRQPGRSFRRRRRQFAWFPFLIILGLIVGLLPVSRNWLGQWLRFDTSENQILSNAEQAFASGDLNKAIQILRQYLEDNPNDPTATSLLARALVYRSYSDYNRIVDRGSALDLTEKAIAEYPREHSLIAMRAFVLQSMGQAEEANRLALRVIERDPDHVSARVALSLSYGGMGLFDAALREATRAFELAQQVDPRWEMDALRAMAVAYGDLGKYENAILASDRAIAAHRQMPPLYFERALYARLVGDWDSAAHSYYQVLVYDEDNIKARLRICQASSELGDHQTALDFCREVTQQAPTWTDGWYQLGREYFLAGNFEEAQDAFNRCTTLQVMQGIPAAERRFECWYIQGQAAELLGDCNALVAIYNEFQEMAAHPDVHETWVYAPEGPANCPLGP